MLKPRSLLVFVAAIAFAPSAQALGPAEMKDRTASFAAEYLRVWSSNNVAPITGVPDMYARTVKFYGRHYTQDRHCHIYEVQAVSEGFPPAWEAG